MAHALLIKTIDMILISIHPFAFKKLFLLVVAFLCVSSALCFADSLFMARQFAPDQHRSTLIPSRIGEIGASARVVSFAANFERDYHEGAVCGSSEGAWGEVPVQIGTALAETGIRDSSTPRPDDYVMGWRAVDTEETFVRTLAERQIFLF